MSKRSDYRERMARSRVGVQPMRHVAALATQGAREPAQPALEELRAQETSAAAALAQANADLDRESAARVARGLMSSPEYAQAQQAFLAARFAHDIAQGLLTCAQRAAAGQVDTALTYQTNLRVLTRASMIADLRRTALLWHRGRSPDGAGVREPSVRRGAGAPAQRHAAGRHLRLPQPRYTDGAHRDDAAGSPQEDEWALAKANNVAEATAKTPLVAYTLRHEFGHHVNGYFRDSSTEAAKRASDYVLTRLDRDGFPGLKSRRATKTLQERYAEVFTALASGGRGR